jgi:hypothetical protein
MMENCVFDGKSKAGALEHVDGRTAQRELGATGGSPAMNPRHEQRARGSR